MLIVAPGAIERFLLIPETDQVEYLTGGNNQRIDQIHKSFIPQSCNLIFIERSEAIFIYAVQPLDMQGFSIFKNNIQHNRTKKVQGQGSIDETFGRLLTLNQLANDR